MILDLNNNKGLIFLGPEGLEKQKIIRSLASKIVNSKTNKVEYSLSEKLNEFEHLDYFELSKSELKEDEKSTIKVDEIREMIAFFRKKSFYSGYKVALVDSLHNLNIQASNALLKILEEPPQNCFIFLTATNLLNILPTIKSRCSVVRFLPKKSELASYEEKILARSNGYYETENNLDLVNSIIEALAEQKLDFKKIAKITSDYNKFAKIIDAIVCEKENPSIDLRQELLLYGSLAEKFSLNKEDLFLITKGKVG